MFRVLLISFANWDSLMELPGVLRKGGCSIDVYSKKASWALQNKSYDRWIPASEDPGIFVNELLDLIKKHGDDYDWVIPGDDPLIRLLNEAITDEKLFYKIMPVSKIENREILGSKAGLSNLAAKYNINTPRHLIYNQSLRSDSIGDYMGYPLLMKLDKSEAGTGIFMCEDELGLKSNLDKITDKTNVVFQQFIKGYDINIEVLYRNGEMLVYSYSRVLTILGNFGLSTRRLFCRNADITAELVKIGRSIGINGFASVAFMYSETEKKHYLIEVDVRPNSWIYYGKFMGNDFSAAVKKIISGDLTLISPDNKAPKEMKISHYLKDVSRCIVKKDIKDFSYWLLNRDHYWRYIPLYDYKTFAACNRYLFRFFKELFINKIKKTFGHT